METGVTVEKYGMLEYTTKEKKRNMWSVGRKEREREVEDEGVGFNGCRCKDQRNLYRVDEN
jgi:hypothetical protein